MLNELMTTANAAELIERGGKLAIAGPKVDLERLPAGHWIGGTIPYFMLPSGGTVVTDGKVFVTDLSAVGDVHIAYQPADDLAGIARNAPENGFSFTIIPAGSSAHQRFAAEAASYEGAFLKPTVGWIAGVHLSDLGHDTALVYDGRTRTAHADGAVVAYVGLPDDKAALVEIVNLFEADGTDVLTFDETSFAVRRCRVNGEQVDFAEYVRQRGLEHGRLPLVGDFAGARVNVSLQSVGSDGTVALYAPVFPGVDYHFARQVPDYAAAFRDQLEHVSPQGVVLGCNCILNFLYGELEGKAIGGVAGPVTFGEIAYQLLNQTMVMVRIV
ncbi:DUF6976 family protein [Ideonella sp. A 288]|uniref:DUF6976 family protein n=1 Tax=Ideonella sp. A 288 TaxID=1962181 RepID=UPI000B4B4F11|nr:hypothetical protein [Ideonella sp. A 288]